MSGGPYVAPECWDLRLTGEVYDHPDPRHPDGKAIVTSMVHEIYQEKKQVLCRSRTYQLEGPADSKWIQWLKDKDLYEKYKDLVEGVDITLN